MKTIRKVFETAVRIVIAQEPTNGGRTIFTIRHRWTGKVLHTIEVGDRRIELHAPDLRGIDLTNLNLESAQLSFAKLDRLSGANLQDADLCGAEIFGSLSYTNLAGCDLSESDLSGVTEAYPANVDKHTRLCGATGIVSGSDIAILRQQIGEARQRLYR